MTSSEHFVPLLAAFAIAIWCANPTIGLGGDAEVARGKYLVQIAGCTDCHTPGYRRGNPDMTRYLGGSDVGIGISGLGTFVPPNLTPDKQTGLGNWTRDQIITAIQTGLRPDGRILAAVMPWRAYAGLTRADASAIVDYLKTLAPVRHKVPGPFGPNERPSIFRLIIVPPNGTYVSGQ